MDICTSVSPDLFDSDHSPVSLFLPSGKYREVARTSYDWHSIAQLSDKNFQNISVKSYSDFHEISVSALNSGKSVTVVHNRIVPSGE